MSEKKEKKVTEREKVMREVAQMVMQGYDMDAIYRTKEGLMVEKDGEQIVMKFIQKKNRVTQEDIKETIEREYGDVDCDFSLESEEADADEVELDEEEAEVAV